MDGPKNDGTSLDVVTGVFKSPGCGSLIDGSSVHPVLGSHVAFVCGIFGGEFASVSRYCKHVSKLKTFIWWAAAAAADSVSRKVAG